MPPIELESVYYVVAMSLAMVINVYLSYNRFVRKWLASFLRKDTPRIIDVTKKKSDLAMPEPVQESAQAIEELGFQQFAISETHLPELNAVGITWHFSNSEKGIRAELVEYQAAVEFTTHFDDNTIVETSYPIGENFSTRTYHRRFSRRSISEAYQIHQEQMRKVTAENFRIPRPIGSIDEYIMDYHIYQARFARYKYLPGLLRGMGKFIVANALVGLILVMFSIVVIPDLHVSAPTLIIVIVTIIAGLVIPAFKHSMDRSSYHRVE